MNKFMRIGSKLIRIAEGVELSFNQIRDKLIAALEVHHGDYYDNGWWVKDVFQSYVIVEIDGEYIKHSYTLTDGEVTVGDPEAVTIDYVAEAMVISGIRLVEAVAGADGADPDGRHWKTIIITEGKSENGNFYSRSVLEAAIPLFEGARCLARSDEEHLQGAGKSVRNIVGFFEGVAWSDEHQGLVGDFSIFEAAAWLSSTMKDAWDAGKKDIVDFSIVAFGTGRVERTAEGLQRAVEKITKVESIDTVVDGSAGGQILGLAEAENQNKEDFLMLEKMLKLLEAKRPDLYAQIDQSNIDEVKVEALLAEAVANPKPAVKSDPAKPAGGADPAPTADQIELKEALNEFRQEKTSFYLERRLAESKLPEGVQVLVRGQFDGRIAETSEIEKAIASHRKAYGDLGGGEVKGLGGEGLTLGLNESEKIMHGLDGMFAGKDINDVARFVSVREAYIMITGDQRISGRMSEAKNLRGGFRISEALTSSSFGEILGDSITRAMLAAYKRSDLSSWRKIVSVAPLGDFRTNRRTRLGGYGDLPAVAESGSYDALTSPTDEEATYAASKRGGTESVTIEMIKNDDVGAIQRIPTALGRAADRTLYTFVFTFLSGNGAIYDAVALFHADHGNLGSAALDSTTLEAGALAMSAHKDMDDAEVLGLSPKYLVVPRALGKTAWELTHPGFGMSNDIATYLQSQGIEVIVNKLYTDANNWQLVADPMDVPTIEIGFLDGKEEPELFISDNPSHDSLFTNDLIKYKIRHIYGGAVMDYRGFYGAVVA
ncbi:hypothetical protein HQ531_03535 [bacterium]|nr:hypothetical protein [bacterium]